MQRKLLYSSVLCALFSVSGIAFGMKKNDPEDQSTFLALNTERDFQQYPLNQGVDLLNSSFSKSIRALFGVSGIVSGMKKNDSEDQSTFLVLNINNNFVAFSRSSLDQEIIHRDKDEFESNWTERGFKQYLLNRGDDLFASSFSKSIRTFDFPSQLTITDKNDISTLSVITAYNKKPINLGDFKKSNIKKIKKGLAEPNNSEILLFKAGVYYPINQITDKYLNEEIYGESSIAVESRTIEPFAKRRTIEFIKSETIELQKDAENQRNRNNQTLESKTRRPSLIGRILLIGGGSILVLAYFFPERFTQFFNPEKFTQFFQSFKRA